MRDQQSAHLYPSLQVPRPGPKTHEKTPPGGWFLTCSGTISLHRRKSRASGGPKTFENISSYEQVRPKHWKTYIHIAHGLPAAARWPPGSSHGARKLSQGPPEAILEPLWTLTGALPGSSQRHPETPCQSAACLALATNENRQVNSKKTTVTGHLSQATSHKSPVACYGGFRNVGRGPAAGGRRPLNI